MSNLPEILFTSNPAFFLITGLMMNWILKKKIRKAEKTHPTIIISQTNDNIFQKKNRILMKTDFSKYFENYFLKKINEDTFQKYSNHKKIVFT